MRVGNYRVIMRIKGSEVVIYALRILHRREAYK
ncbi:type II toxin-antitoxin system RelE family toxin [Desulforamulus profundi]